MIFALQLENWRRAFGIGIGSSARGEAREEKREMRWCRTSMAEYIGEGRAYPRGF